MLYNRRKFLFLLFLIVLVITSICDAKKKKKRTKTKQAYSMVLRQKETNAVDFIRLVVMRLIYGVASRIGLGEQISEALNGVFVPPGVENEYGDYGEFDLLDRDDDDDYDYR
ncbi:structure-specific endonuclease subunit slx1 [Holotrichia oblita]|uniref:Structure-specific endonuclease subunit slx1 n=1 Tax=Holotrichia oblita TaxID=644536 RepID=A0ACB9SHS3_HOLOL|nr:structure-specific endonuclease subunit slx1 [Holotrichia oblita]